MNLKLHYAGIKRYYEKRLGWLSLKTRALIVNSRPLTLLLPLLGGYFLIQASLPSIQFPTPNPIRTWIAIISLILINMGGNNLNSVFDLPIDKINKPYRPLPKGLLSKEGVMLFASLCFISTIFLSSFINPEFLFLCFLMTILTYFYSIPPVRLKRILWVNNITQATIRGIIGPLAAWIVYGSLWNPRIWAICLIMFTLILPLQTTKDFPDVSGDVKYGIRTLPIVYGVPRTIRILRLLVTIPFVFILFLIHVLTVFPSEALYFLVLFLPSYVSIGMFKTMDSFENTLGWVLFYIIMISFLFGFMLIF